MGILQVIAARERDLGGFVVRRVLPFAQRQMVGPFIFFDHVGPTQFSAGTGVDVRPHPHIALATVTYLFAGSLEHRDSLGSVQEILPGDVNWMTAGTGIVHSERTPASARMRGETMHGIQSWVALPDGHEDDAPAFDHYSAASLPRRDAAGVHLTCIAGSAFGMRSPVRSDWPTLYVAATLAAGTSLALPSEHEERAVYVVEGDIEVDGRVLAAGSMGVLDGAVSMITAASAARLMLLGGARFATPRHLWWNFVASSPARIDDAKRRWREGKFPSVPGESEFIPLPPA